MMGLEPGMIRQKEETLPQKKETLLQKEGALPQKGGNLPRKETIDRGVRVVVAGGTGMTRSAD
jgi:hypothetical protein